MALPVPSRMDHENVRLAQNEALRATSHAHLRSYVTFLVDRERYGVHVVCND
jgi:hypothetical protein